jgi:hypothetical protein
MYILNLKAGLPGDPALQQLMAAQSMAANPYMNQQQQALLGLGMGQGTSLFSPSRSRSLSPVYACMYAIYMHVHTCNIMHVAYIHAHIIFTCMQDVSVYPDAQNGERFRV